MTLREAIIEAQKMKGARVYLERGLLSFQICYPSLTDGAFIPLQDAVATDWEVRLPAPPPMDFKTAMGHLQEGRKVWRRTWMNFHASKFDDEELCVRCFDREDIEATDWEVVR